MLGSLWETKSEFQTFPLRIMRISSFLRKSGISASLLQNKSDLFPGCEFQSDRNYFSCFYWKCRSRVSSWFVFGNVVLHLNEVINRFVLRLCHISGSTSLQCVQPELLWLLWLLSESCTKLFHQTNSWSTNQNVATKTSTAAEDKLAPWNRPEGPLSIKVGEDDCRDVHAQLCNLGKRRLSCRGWRRSQPSSVTILFQPD